MDKLQTNIVGGFPFNLDDLRFQDDAYRLAFADVCKTLVGVGPIILFGCETAQYSNYISVSEGAIFFQGEVWHVYPHNFSIVTPMPDFPYWNFVNVNGGAAGYKTFEDGQAHWVHKVRNAVGSMLPTAGAEASIDMSIVGRYQPITTSEVEIPLAPGVGLVNNSYKAYLVKQGRLVSIAIEVNYNGETTGNKTLIATIPAGYRPASYPSGIAEGRDGTVMSYFIDKNTGEVSAGLLVGIPLGGGGATTAPHRIVLQITYMV